MTAASASAVSSWSVTTALAGTIGTTVASGITLLLPRSTIALTAEPDRFAASVFQNLLLNAILSGSCLGIALGISFAFAWEPLLVHRSIPPQRWYSWTIGSTSVAFCVASVAIVVGTRFVGHAFIITALSGAGAGCMMGTVQAHVLWATNAVRWRWILIHMVASTGAWILLAMIERDVSGLILRPVIWLSIWGLYGTLLGTAYAAVAYRDQ